MNFKEDQSQSDQQDKCEISYNLSYDGEGLDKILDSRDLLNEPTTFPFLLK